MKKITFLLALVLISLSGFSQTRRTTQARSDKFPSPGVPRKIDPLPSGELRNDTLFRNVSYEQFLYVKKKYDDGGIAFYYYSGCCSFGEVGGRIPKITEVFLVKENDGQEHKLITGDKPGSL